MESDEEQSRFLLGLGSLPPTRRPPQEGQEPVNPILAVLRDVPDTNHAASQYQHIDYFEALVQEAQQTLERPQSVLPEDRDTLADKLFMACTDTLRGLQYAQHLHFSVSDLVGKLLARLRSALNVIGASRTEDVQQLQRVVEAFATFLPNDVKTPLQEQVRRNCRGG